MQLEELKPVVSMEPLFILLSFPCLHSFPIFFLLVFWFFNGNIFSTEGREQCWFWGCSGADGAGVSHAVNLKSSVDKHPCPAWSHPWALHPPPPPHPRPSLALQPHPQLLAQLSDLVQVAQGGAQNFVGCFTPRQSLQASPQNLLPQIP